ncbi:MAG: hypothetical protein KA792_07620, partial [Bacteroidales bacterium]|nr:hypothetical protein [Bacteroidales bacterium]
MSKVLFIDTTDSVLKTELENAGFECAYFADWNIEDYIKNINEYTGIIIRSKFRLDKEILDKAIKLKFIGRVGSGLENIDLTYATKKGIRCFNSPEGNRDAVGEHTIGLLLSLLNKINIANRQVKQALWLREENRGLEIKGKTIAIIGYGNMGSAFAEKIRAFGAEIIAYDKYKKDYAPAYVIETDLKTIFLNADILSLHVPLTPETHYLVNNEFINNFSKNIYLINTSRGSVVKTSDLVKGLESGKIIGAALDVLEYEDISFEKMNFAKLPADFDYLVKADNVILTPHIA